MERIENIYNQEIKDNVINTDELNKVQAFIDSNEALENYNSLERSIVPQGVKKLLKHILSKNPYKDFLSPEISYKIGLLDSVGLHLIFSDYRVEERKKELNFYFNYVKRMLLTRNFTQC